MTQHCEFVNMFVQHDIDDLVSNVTDRNKNKNRKRPITIALAVIFAACTFIIVSLHFTGNLTRQQESSMIVSSNSTTSVPTVAPSFLPTNSPIVSTHSPTDSPTELPTELPTGSPTASPTRLRTKSPTKFPTEFPTEFQTEFPTQFPTALPTESPTILSTQLPTNSSRNSTITSATLTGESPKRTNINLQSVTNTKPQSGDASKNVKQKHANNTRSMQNASHKAAIEPPATLNKLRSSQIQPLDTGRSTTSCTSSTSRKKDKYKPIQPRHFVSSSRHLDII